MASSDGMLEGDLNKMVGPLAHADNLEEYKEGCKCVRCKKALKALEELKAGPRVCGLCAQGLLKSEYAVMSAFEDTDGGQNISIFLVHQECVDKKFASEAEA
jgi:hypothetical protein